MDAKPRLFHVMDGGSNLHGWDMAAAPIPTLISLAHFEDKKNSMQTERGLRVIRDKCYPLILDSGRLTWMKKGLSDMARVDLTPRLLEVAAMIGATVVVAGDVPMEPKFLARVGLRKEEAMGITMRANEELRSSSFPGLRGYVIQGFDEEDYVESIAKAKEAGLSEEVEAGRAIWIIGSVCLAPPEKVERIAKLVRNQLPGVIHMLGQGRPGIIARLRELGVQWADSGTAAGYAARGKWLFPHPEGKVAWKRLHDGRRLPPEAYGLLVRNNMEVLELCIS